MLPQFTLPDGSLRLVGERRSKVRFPLSLQVRYRTLWPTPATGVGRTVNMSSNGILVEHPHQLSQGAELELRIEWPLLLEGEIGLQLVATAKVVRSEPSGFAASFVRYQFRTVRRNLLSASASDQPASRT